MIPYKNNLYVVRNILKSSVQKTCFVRDLNQRRLYAVSKGDDDIKWQWEVRESPCGTCHNYKKKKKKGLIAKILKKKDCDEELTNRHKEIIYKPKIWEWSYYSYLLPECEIKEVKKDICQEEPKYGEFQTQNSQLVCPPRNHACDGKRVSVSLEKEDDRLKAQTEKLQIEFKEPFCLNQVCGQKKPPEEDKGKKDFVCLNHLIENKSNDDSCDNNKKGC